MVFHPLMVLHPLMEFQMASSSSNLRRCTCNYRCAHTPQGWQLISRSTYYEHCNHDLSGNVHPIQQREVQIESEERMPSHAEQAREMNTSSRVMERRRVFCSCLAYCQGGRHVAPSTYVLHQQLRHRYEGLGTHLGFLEQGDTNENVSQDLHDEPNENELHDLNDEPIDPPIVFASVDELQGPSLCNQILEKIIEFQALWDEHQIPIKAQDKMLELLFGDMGGRRVGRSGKCKKPSLSKLLVQLPKSWDGTLDGIRVPACWEQLNSMFNGLGMIQSQRYRLCIGPDDNRHDIELLQPSEEDVYAGNAILCSCHENARKRIFKRDCSTCCEKCKKCNKPRKEMLAFDYLPIGKQLELLVKSKTNCHDLLNMWRRKERWLGEEINAQPDSICEFWDGSKCREVQDFWNPNAEYELPMVCGNPKCNKVYTTYPTSCFSEVLKRGWNEGTQEYELVCKQCRFSNKCKKKSCKVYISL